MASRSDAPKPMRLQRYLAAAGIGSRRECEALIESGRVEVDGETVVEQGCTVVPGKSTIRVDTEKIVLKPRKYFLLNKPAGVVCTHKDPSGRPKAVDLIPHSGEHLFTVGRLDESTEGLLIVTNDGDLSERLAHPRYEVLRTYRALVAGDPSGEVFEQLRKGMHFREGKFKVQHVKRIKKQGRSTLVELQIAEGQNREVRRLLARAGHKVMHLQRVAFGPLRLGKLLPGEYRPLTAGEKQELLEFAAASPKSRKKSFDKFRKRQTKRKTATTTKRGRPSRRK